MAPLPERHLFFFVVVMGIWFTGLFILLSKSNDFSSIRRASKTDTVSIERTGPRVTMGTKQRAMKRPRDSDETQWRKSRRKKNGYRKDKEKIKSDYLRSQSFDEFSASKQLHEDYVPPDVHYVLCSHKTIEFRQYMSMLSTIRSLQPDKLIIHYRYDLVMDRKMYNQWLIDLKQQFPFLSMKMMTDEEGKVCDGDTDDRITMVISMLSTEGGIYVSDNTWFTQFNPKRRRVDFEYSLSDNSLSGYIILRKGVYQAGIEVEEMLQNKSIISVAGTCSELPHFYNDKETPDCIIISGERYSTDFYPKDIWYLNDKFGRIAREILYGSPDMLFPKSSHNEVVPNIGHMVWIGGKVMDFLFYLSALSALYVANVDMLYIHGDKEPPGEYWPKLRNDSRVKFILRSPPTHIYQSEIEPYYRSLMSDVIRVDLMIKYGGIYTDTDAIWVKPLSRQEMGYEAVACYDWVNWSYPFPDTVNFGVSYGKRNAPFWHLFRESMRSLHNKRHGFTGVQMPYKVLEKHPDLLRIDKRLSVICYQEKCHPIWVNDYHNETNNHVTSGSITNWREDVHAFHWTYPNPQVFKDMDTLLNSTGMFAEIGQFVLKKAGLYHI